MAGPDRAIRRQLEASNLELGYQMLKQRIKIQEQGRDLLQQERKILELEAEVARLRRLLEGKPGNDGEQV